jgi:oligoribonuclease
VVVHQTDAVLGAMDEWNRKHHGRSGLIHRVKDSTMDEAEVESIYLEFMKQYVPRRPRRCAATRSARIAASWRATCRSWKTGSTTATSTCRRSRNCARAGSPDVYEGAEEERGHEALADIIESIDELKYYREHFLKV